METLDYSIFPEKQTAYAGFWERFAASFIDGLIVGIPLLIIEYLLSLDTNSIPVLLANQLVGWLYYSLQDSSPHMATLGKRAMNIKVSDLDANRIPFSQATGRYFAKTIPSYFVIIVTYFFKPSPGNVQPGSLGSFVLWLLVVFLFALIWYLYMLFDSRNQTLYDKIAGTVVIK